MKSENFIEIIEDGNYVNLPGFTFLTSANVDIAAWINKFNSEWVTAHIMNEHSDVQKVYPFFLTGCKQERNNTVSIAGYAIAKHNNGMFKIFSFTRIDGRYSTYGLNYEFNKSQENCVDIIEKDHNGHMLSCFPSERPSIINYSKNLGEFQ